MTTTRFGNKSVNALVRDDEDMPFTEDGRRVDLLLNLLAIVNRTTSFPLYELFINGSGYQVRQHMKTLKTQTEKENELFDFIRILNEEEAEDFYSRYQKLSSQDKKTFIEDTINNGFYIHQTPLWETKPIFYRCQELRRRFPYISQDTLYVRCWGRKKKILTKFFIGEMYIMKLKLLSLLIEILVENSVNCWNLLRA